jgi:hypothetical protein
MANADILLSTPELFIAYHAQVCIIIPRSVPDVPMLDSIRLGLNGLSSRHPSGVALLFIVDAKSPPPDGAARAAAADFFANARTQIKVMSAHIVGAGFVAAAKRSVFTWLTSGMLGKLPFKTSASIGEACDWLEAQCKTLGVKCPSSAELQLTINNAAPK